MQLNTQQVFVMASDASKQGAKVPGMGGFFGVMWWTLALTEELLLLEIPALELMAFGVNVIMFRDMIQQLTRGGVAMVVAYIDAQASPQLLIKRGTTSKAMSRVLQQVLGLWQMQEVMKVMSVAHTYGEGNDLSDMSSRGRLDDLQSYCKQMGVRSRQVQLTDEVWLFVENVLVALREQ